MKIDKDTVREIAETLGSNKRRSIATAFGIFWGMFMLIILLSLSNGLRNGIEGITQSLSPNIVYLGKENTSLPYDGFPKGRSWVLYGKDLTRAQQLVPDVSLVAGVYHDWLDEKGINYEGRTSQGTLMGVTDNYFQTYSVELLKGRMLNAVDYQENRKCCLIGEKLAKKLFPDGTNPVGKRISAKNTSMIIVGVIRELSEMIHLGGDLGRSIILPIRVVQQMSGHPDELSFGVLSFENGKDKSAILKRFTAVIKDLNHIAPQDDKAFDRFSPDDILQVFNNINRNLNILIWIVGIGTLITGIVGISNILLVTVKERTSEIGIRRALGAKPTDIIMQLMLEALSLNLLSGLLGIMLSVGIMSLVAEQFKHMTDIPFLNPTVDLSTVLLALLILLCSGVLSGILPALKAIEIKAIEAIREE